MGKERIASYEQFMDQVKYPMVMFEAESGKVLQVNYEASVMFGKQVERVFIEPRNARVHQEFWDNLHMKKSLFWHRIRLVADETEFAVSGFVSEIVNDAGVVIYTVIFETQMKLGGLVLESVLTQAKMASIYLSVHGDERKMEYVSQNINMFGFTSTQFYTGAITIPYMICREDRKHVEQAFYRARDRHADQALIECRILTEKRELIPVRISVRYVYNESDNLSALEILIFDLRDEIYRKRENDYLNQAISKMKNVLLVQNYYRDKRELMFISPNATSLGINVEAIQNGLKLTEDYIHPADREAVIGNIYRAIENGAAEIEQTYRMVGDDGKLIWVHNEISLERRSDFGAQVSFLLTDVTEQKMIEQKLAYMQEEIDQIGSTQDQVGEPFLDIRDPETIQYLESITKVLNGNASYYNAVFDLYANRVGVPVGPQERMGMLYDMFERPEFREIFMDVKNRAVLQKIPIQTTLPLDGQLVQMIFAPVMLKNEVRAFWALIDFEQLEISQLALTANEQAKIANAVGKSIFIERIIKKEENLRKLSTVRLEKTKKNSRLTNEMLELLVSKDGSNCGRICQVLGMHLNVPYVGVYLQNKDTKSVEKYFAWSEQGGEEDVFDQFVVDAQTYQSFLAAMKEKQSCVIDENSAVVCYKQLLQKVEVDSMLLCPIWTGDHIRGYLVCADGIQQHRYDEESRQAVRSTAMILGEMIFERGQDSHLRESLEQSFEVYNHMAEAMYVKDNQTGKIVFSNNAMKHLFGHDLVGMDANRILVNRMQQYQQMDSVRNLAITNKKLTKWQTYMKELNRVMNIKEIQLLDYEDGYSVIIMKETDLG